jgi:hypothetical protein
MEVSGQLHASAALTSGKEPRYPLDRRQEESQSGHSVEKKDSQPLAGIEPRSSDRLARNQSLYRLSYPGS